MRLPGPDEIRHPLVLGRKVLRRLGWDRMSERLRPAGPGGLEGFNRALGWIEANTLPGGGVRVTADGAAAYPEVTGYFIPTLLDWGERARAMQYARWLISIQHPDGFWLEPAGKAAYTFDTGQILKGLLAVLPDMPEAREPLRRGCDWLLTQIEDSGRVCTPDTSAWSLPGGRTVPDSIHLYAVEPLRRAVEIFGRDDYARAVDRVLAYYLSKPDLAEFATLSHFHAYVIEALIDLGHIDRAAAGMAAIERLQRGDGSVPAYPDVNWVCSTGLAQYAAIWYRLGRAEPAERAFSRLCRMQNRSGGFFGSHGRGANYFPKQEIGWAVKYFLDALTWRICRNFDDSADGFPQILGEIDGRFRLIEETLREFRPSLVLDAGCGRGRFIRLLKERNPDIQAVGLDVSERMLSHLPPNVERSRGSLLRIPLDLGSVDMAFCVEALEHAVNVPAAIREMGRVVAKPGILLVIDKNESNRGALKINDWEQWFAAGDVKRLLEAEGFAVEIRGNIPYDNSDGSDGLFLGWVARR